MTTRGEPLYDPKYLARQVLRVIADTWTPIVLFCLKGRIRRFNELQRSIPDISKKMLTQTLRGMERDGLIERNIHRVVPPHVEYQLSPIGQTLIPLLRNLCHWAKANAKWRDEARRLFDHSPQR